MGDNKVLDLLGKLFTEDSGESTISFEKETVTNSRIQSFLDELEEKQLELLNAATDIAVVSEVIGVDFDSVADRYISGDLLLFPYREGWEPDFDKQEILVFMDSLSDAGLWFFLNSVSDGVHTTDPEDYSCANKPGI